MTLTITDNIQLEFMECVQCHGLFISQDIAFKMCPKCLGMDVEDNQHGG